MVQAQDFSAWGQGVMWRQPSKLLKIDRNKLKQAIILRTHGTPPNIPQTLTGIRAILEHTFVDNNLSCYLREISEITT